MPTRPWPPPSPFPTPLPSSADGYFEVAVAVVDEHLGRCRLSVLHDIRQPFLHKSIRSEVDARGKLEGLALDAQLDRQARFPRLVDEAAQVIEARLWSESRRLFGTPQTRPPSGASRRAPPAPCRSTTSSASRSRS